MEPREQTVIRIGHLTGTSPAFGFLWIGEERRYRLTAHVIRRPATGKKLVELQCDTCGAELLLRVRSMELSRTIRKRYALTSLIGLAVAAVLIGAAILFEDPSTSTPGWTGLDTTLVVVPLLSLAVFGIGWYAWYHEEGLRLYSTTGTTDETHRLLFGAQPHDAAMP